MDNYYYEQTRLVSDLHVNFEHILISKMYIPGHWHECIEILYMKDGRLETTIKNQTKILKKDDLILVNPRDLHSTRCLNECDYILLQIPYPMLKNYIPEIDSIRFEIPPFPESAIVGSKICQMKEIILEMSALVKEKPVGFHLKFTSLLFEMLYLLYHNFQVPADPDTKEKNTRNLERLKPILEYVKKHYNEKILLNEISSYAGFTPEYFCRFFKRHMGITFVEYLNQYRFNCIYQDLCCTDTSLLLLLEQHGFTNYKLFRKMFYDIFGCTPGQIRKELSTRKDSGNQYTASFWVNSINASRDI